jgi:spore germination protein
MTTGVAARHHSRRSLVIAAIVVVAVAVAGAVAYTAFRPASTLTAVPASTTASTFRVTGFAETGDTTKAQINDSAKVLTNVGVDGVNLTSDGDGITAVDPDSLTLLHEAHADGKTADLLFGNFSDEIGDFSQALAEKMFNSPTHISDVAAALSAEVTNDGWDGITVDLESLNNWGADRGADNAGLDAFVTALRSALGSKTISICISATTGSYADLGYDLGTLSAQVNNFVLMAYDQHGPTWSNAGPVGGYPWVKASVADILKSVPSSSVQLGIAEYGYSWPKGHESSAGKTYTDHGARKFVADHHAKSVWSVRDQEWHATTSGGTVIWWSDHKSFESRLKLAHSLKLGGVAVWSLGEGDPL